MSNFISELEKQYFEELKEFYSPYFPTLEEVDVFINKAIQLDWDDRRPRQMLFQVQRFVSLATEIDKIRPERDGLRMLFLKLLEKSTCLLVMVVKNLRLFFLRQKVKMRRLLRTDYVEKLKLLI